MYDTWQCRSVHYLLSSSLIITLCLNCAPFAKYLLVLKTLGHLSSQSSNPPSSLTRLMKVINEEAGRRRDVLSGWKWAECQLKIESVMFVGNKMLVCN